MNEKPQQGRSKPERCRETLRRSSNSGAIPAPASTSWRKPSITPFWILTLTLTLAIAGTGCRRDMFQQPSSRPLESSDFFQDNHMASRPLVQHTVARGHLDADDAFYKGKIGTNLVETFPFPITREVLERGRERFNIYCSPCHGQTGEGNGMVVQRGFPVPPSYHIDRLRQAPVGHFFDVMTQGYGMMYSYAARVEPTDRWAIAAYIRALQKSQDITLAQVPPDQRAKLQEERK
jgi:cytochrome c553